MAGVDDDRPLLLRKRVTEYAPPAEEGGEPVPLSWQWELRDPLQRGFPRRHEFGKDLLLELVSDGAATVSSTRIVLTLVNGTGTYRRAPELDVQTYIDAETGEERTVRANGLWGVLVDEQLTEVPA